MKKIQLRDYQQEAESFLKNETGKLVLALCPNSGKTEVTISFINNYIKGNSDKKVLILAHSTNVLLDNFTNRISNSDVCFSFSEDLSDDSSVHVSIPQRKNNIVCKYDIIIVDEAHENFLAKTVQQIIKDSTPEKVILLTGTPSKFIGDKSYKFHFYSLSELKNNFRSKLSIKISNSTYNWEGNYNNKNEIKSNFKFTKEDTESSLAEALKNCILGTENNIQKTLIVCKTIKQSNLVNDYLINKNISCVVSNSENDLSSEVINKFKNGCHNVLIVVNRARLGFDDSELVNLIDMSGTLNPDLIYQMYSRVCRKGEAENKRYIRLRGNNESLENTKLAVNIALMLVSEKYLSTYNGKNLSGQQVLISKEFFNKETNKNREPSEDKKERKMFFEDAENVIDFYSECLNSDDYKVCSVSDVIKFLGGKVYRYRITYEIAKEICLKYKTPNELKSADSGIYSWINDNPQYREDLYSHMNWVRQNNSPINYLELKKECLKCKTPNEFKVKNRRLYSYVCKNPHLKEDLYSHMNKKRIITYEIAKKVALMHNSIKDINIADKGVYSWIGKNPQYREDLYSHIELRQVITYELAKEEILKYKTPKEIRDNNPNLYSWVTKNPQYKKELYIHLKVRFKGAKLTFEEVRKECLRYGSMTNLRHNNPKAYTWIFDNKDYKKELYDLMDAAERKIIKVDLEYAKECVGKCKSITELNSKFSSVYKWILIRPEYKEELYSLLIK